MNSPAPPPPPPPTTSPPPPQTPPPPPPPNRLHDPLILQPLQKFLWNHELTSSPPPHHLQSFPRRPKIRRRLPHRRLPTILPHHLPMTPPHQIRHKIPHPNLAADKF